MLTGPRIESVAYDATHRRFIADVALDHAGQKRRMQISAPGHPAWGFRRIVAALNSAAEKVRPGLEASHARA